MKGTEVKGKESRRGASETAPHQPERAFALVTLETRLVEYFLVSRQLLHGVNSLVTHHALFNLRSSKSTTKFLQQTK